MIRIIFPNGFPVSPPPVPSAMSYFVPVLRFLRFAWNDGNKKIDFPNDIYPSVGKRDTSELRIITPAFTALA